MKHRFVFALACASVLSAAAVTAVSCKSNTITQNNNEENFDAVVTAPMKPDQDFNLLGPDNSLVHAPAGAVDKSVDIVLGKLKGGYPLVPDGWVPTGGIYAFEPHAQTFGKPVKIRVPFNMPGNGAAVRLATAEPGGSWTPVDYADGARLGQDPDEPNLPGVYGVINNASHFSYYAVFTGKVPEDKTIVDAGVDAAPDAAPDAPPDVAPPEAGPPPATTLFALGNNGVYRWQLTPPVVIPGNDAGIDASADGGNLDGGVVGSLGDGSTPVSLAMGSNNGTYTLFADGITNPEAGTGAVAVIGDPFGAFTLAGGFAPASPGVMGYFRNELWMSIGNPPNIATYDGTGTKTWDGSGANMTTNAAGYGGIAYDPATSTVFLSVQGPDAIQRWLVSGNAGGPKQAIKQTPDITSQNVFQPGPMAVTPWGELLVVSTGDRSIARFDMKNNFAYIGSWNAGRFLLTPGNPIAVVRWPNGVDEMFIVDVESSVIGRFVFTDATHNTFAPVTTNMPTNNDPIYALIVAP